jgi:hypothetical protein
VFRRRRTRSVIERSRPIWTFGNAKAKFKNIIVVGGVNSGPRTTCNGGLSGGKSHRGVAGHQEVEEIVSGFLAQVFLRKILKRREFGVCQAQFEASCYELAELESRGERLTVFVACAP